MGEGLQRGAGLSPRLRATAIVNGMTRRGPFLSNNFAVLGNTYILIFGISMKCLTVKSMYHVNVCGQCPWCYGSTLSVIVMSIYLFTTCYFVVCVCVSSSAVQSTGVGHSSGSWCGGLTQLSGSCHHHWTPLQIHRYRTHTQPKKCKCFPS